jgi:hypothetical protein
MNSKHSALSSFALLLLASLSACEGEFPAADHPGDRTPNITNGVPDPGHPAVALVQQGLGTCTGTLIGSRTVLTACHCVDTKNRSVKVTLGGASYTVEPASILMHPGCLLTMLNVDDNSINDVAVLRLPAPVTQIAPVPIGREAPYPGQPLTLVGFGITQFNKADSGVKRRGTTKVGELETQLLLYKGGAGTSASGVCGGDSGGPSFAAYDSDAEVVVGVHVFSGTRNGTEKIQTCGPDNGDMRVDAYWRWIVAASGGDARVAQGRPLGAPAPVAGALREGEQCRSPNACGAGLFCLEAAPGNGTFCMRSCGQGGSVCNLDEGCSKVLGASVCHAPAALADDGFTRPDHIQRGGPGSCAGHCGTHDPVPASNPPCRCDPACSFKNDCCTDRLTVCVKPPSPNTPPSPPPSPPTPPAPPVDPPATPPPSCALHCGASTPVPGSMPACYCDSVCVQKQDCCDDYATRCTAAQPPPSSLCPPAGASAATPPSLGPLDAQPCDRSCWGQGTIYNVCGAGKWQFCLSSGFFAPCQFKP